MERMTYIKGLLLGLDIRNQIPPEIHLGIPSLQHER